MPYYIYKISNADGIGLIKSLELIAEYPKFKEAKIKTRSLRADCDPGTEFIYKLILADNQLMAEEQLLEKREKPTLMEYEI